MKFVDLSEEDRKILSNILKDYLKKIEVNFFAFGSRVTGEAKKYSDLDLAYEGLNPREVRKIKTEIEDSKLSITVDLVDLHEVDFEFQELIRSQMIPFPE